MNNSQNETCNVNVIRMLIVRAHILATGHRMLLCLTGCNLCKQGERVDIEVELIQLTGCPESRIAEMGSVNTVSEEGRRPVEEGVLRLGFVPN